MTGPCGQWICRAFILAVLCVQTRQLKAGPVTIDFESLSDADAVTTQFAGLTFYNATVLTSGISLNEFEFPPHSGNNVAFDDGGPISIFFETSVKNVGGYFNYEEPLTLSGYDGSGNLLGLATSSFSSNLGLSGDPGSIPNEFIQLLGVGPISVVTINGDLGGFSFTVDDVSFDQQSEGTIPESGSFSLLLLGTFALLFAHRGPKSTQPYDN